MHGHVLRKDCLSVAMKRDAGVSADLIRALLSAGARVGVKDHLAIRTAAKLGRFDLVAILKEAGSDINADSCEAFQTILKNHNWDTLRELIKHGGHPSRKWCGGLFYKIREHLPPDIAEVMYPNLLPELMAGEVKDYPDSPLIWTGQHPEVVLHSFQKASLSVERTQWLMDKGLRIPPNEAFHFFYNLAQYTGSGFYSYPHVDRVGRLINSALVLVRTGQFDRTTIKNHSYYRNKDELDQLISGKIGIVTVVSERLNRRKVDLYDFKLGKKNWYFYLDNSFRRDFLELVRYGAQYENRESLQALADKFVDGQDTAQVVFFLKRCGANIDMKRASWELEELIKKDIRFRLVLWRKAARVERERACSERSAASVARAEVKSGKCTVS